MAKRRPPEDPFAALNRIADPAAPEAAALLRSALEAGESLAVARAAEIVRDHELRGYEDRLVAAFDRMLNAGDPQCRAKTAIVDALGTLEYRDSEFFLRHIGYRQPEPVWGGSVDTATHLRGLCGHGLVQSDFRQSLPYLIDLLADPEKVTRQGAAQALALTGREEAALILRTKLLCGDPAPEVYGDGFAALLSLTPADGIPFVARFLDAPEADVRFEAAAALGGSARAEAVAVLIDRSRRENDEAFHEALLLAIGAGRRPEGIDYLLGVVETEPPRIASQALTALSPCRFYPELRDRVESVVLRRDAATLTKQFAREFERE